MSIRRDLRDNGFGWVTLSVVWLWITFTAPQLILTLGLLFVYVLMATGRLLLDYQDGGF